MTPRETAPRVVLVAGGGRGIVQEVALRAAAAGWDVAFTYPSESRAAYDTVSEIESGGTRAVAIRADLGSQSEVRHAFAAAIDRYGRIDAVIHHAGETRDSPAIGEIDETRLLDAFRASVFGVFYCAAEAARRMSTQRGGRGGVIVNIETAPARGDASPAGSREAAARGAVEALTAALARELAPHGIRVHAVHAGAAADVAAAVMFLMSGPLHCARGSRPELPGRT